MAKAFFRFLRGELNGFYLNAIHNTLNKSTEEIKRFLYESIRQQFAYNEMSEENIYNIGKFAGISLLRFEQEDTSFAVHMTESHKIDGEEYSERGLFTVEYETFNFSNALSEGDINSYATKENRSSLVGTEKPLGYIAEDTEDVFDESGNVKPDKILSEPPYKKAYSEFYGEKFTMFYEGLLSKQYIPTEMYVELLKAMQTVRYNGDNIESLVKIVAIICPESLVTISRIETVDLNIINVYYTYNYEAIISYKQQRLVLLNYIVSQKFPKVRLVALT